MSGNRAFNINKIALTAGVALLALTSTPSFAYADASSDQDSAQQAQRQTHPTLADEEIIVTARKREENLGTVPITITAYTSENLKQRNIATLADLGNATPGVSITSIAGGTAQNIYVRGLAPANTANDLNVEANVGVFIDGMYQSSRNTLDMIAVLDVGQIDVLKGPQSSLLGRSTFAGALNISTGRPSTNVRGDVSATIGNYGDYRIRGAISGPIAAGLTGRIAAGYMTSDGWEKNAADPDDRLGGTRKYAVTAALEYASPDDVFKARLAGFITDSKTELSPVALAPLGSFNCGTTNAALGIKQVFCGTLQAPGVYSVTPDIPRTTAKNRQVTLEMKWDLGDVVLASTTGYSGAESRAYNDFDGSSDGVLMGVCTAGAACFPSGAYSRLVRTNLISTVVERVRAFSQELRLQSDTKSPFSWMVGANYFNQRIPVAANGIAADRVGLAANERFVQVSQVATPPATGVGGYDFIANPYIVDSSLAEQTFANWSRARTETWSVFGAVGYDFGRVRINAEGRYNVDQKSAEVFSVSNPMVAPGIYPAIDGTSVPAAGDFPVRAEPFRETFKSFTPRFTIDYRPVDNVFLYASAAKGVRSGGFNTANAVGPTGILASEASYDEESNWTYEFGWKSHMLDKRWELNATYFLVNWDNAQVSSFTENPAAVNAIRIVRNVGKIKARGVEVATQFRATDYLTVGGSFIRSNSKFRDGAYDGSVTTQCIIGSGSTATAADGCPPVIVVDTASGIKRAVSSIGGHRTQRSVKWQWHAFAAAEAPITDDWTAKARVDVNYTGPAYADLINTVSFGKRTLTNFNLSFSNDTLSIALWGKNIFDKRYVSNSILQPRAGLPVFPAVSVPEIYLGERRRIGVTVGAKF